MLSRSEVGSKMRRAILRTTLLRAAFICGAFVLSGEPGAAQESATLEGAHGILPEDSVALLRAARTDQANFERFRRNRLPETWRGGSSRCDERIGRFCLTHGSGRSNWVAPPEDEEVTLARLNLAEGLNQVAQLIPGDGWIAGQRVRYLVEAGRLDDAVVAAAECRAEVSWCSALAGFAHHYSARPEEADSAFAVALGAMEESERRSWTDLSLILDERSLRTYRRLRGDERVAFEDRFWHLADPLLTRPGNELRSEHYARHVWDQFQFRAQSTDGISWGYDLREILIRYGWPTGWERTREWGMAAGPPPLISHYSSSPQYLLPPAAALLDDTGTEGIWEAEELRSRTGYNIPLADSIARWFTPLAHQLAVFRRGGTALVVAAYELPVDSVPDDATVEAGLAIIPTLEYLADARVALASDAGRSGAIVLDTPVEPVLLSLEVAVPSEHRLARARYGLDLAPASPDLLSVSDLLLLRGDAPLPDSLHAAIDAARGSNRVRSGEEIGIYWEMYGLDHERTPAVTLSLRLLEGRTGWLRRLAERAGLMREAAPIRLRWEEGIREGPYQARSLTINIPPVAPGTYALELSVEAPGREQLSVRKEIEVIGE
jgi:hypothetical protein